MRPTQPKIDFVRAHRYLFPERSDGLIKVMGIGVAADYNGEPPLPPRTSGLPYIMGDSDNTVLILSKLWRDIATRGMSLRATDSISLGGSIESMPTATAGKKNPDRSISLDRMVIADSRRANFRFDTKQYYPIAAPSIYGQTRWIMSLVRMCPGVPLKVTIREAGSDFAMLRTRPSLSLAIVAEFPADHVHLETDLVFSYHVMPVGWNGPPSHFAFLVLP